MAATLSQIKTMLETTGFPVAYRAFPREGAPDMPFLCYQESEPNNFYADGVVFHSSTHPEILLYTKEKDPDAEDKVEKALSSFAWRKSETYLTNEQCYEILYEIEV